MRALTRCTLTIKIDRRDENAYCRETSETLHLFGARVDQKNRHPLFRRLHTIYVHTRAHKMFVREHLQSYK